MHFHTSTSWFRQPLLIVLSILWLGSTVVAEEPSSTEAIDPVAKIDQAVEAGWQTQGLKPAAITDDAAFARRLYLDLVGRIPASAELRDFVADSTIDKREQLIDQLLSSDEHATHLAEVFDAILIGRTDVGKWKRRQEVGWLDYLTDSLRENRPWNQVAAEILLARPETPDQRGATWYLYSRNNEAQQIAEAVSKDFFGVRIDCAQCHDHPLAYEIEQRHYWGLVAFFNRSKNIDTADGPRLSESAVGGFSNFTSIYGDSAPNELVFLEDRLVDEPRPEDDVQPEDKDELYFAAEGSEPRIPKFSRRERFVEDVLKDHPLAAQAMVNRLWGWMMGRGIVHPVDTIDSFHPASHPELLEWLGKDFANSGYNIRRLIRTLARTRVYQLDSSTTEFIDPQWFSVAQPKPLTAEVLHRSLLTVFDPEAPDRWNSIQRRAEFASLFPDVLSEESLSNVSQSLMLTNGELINQLATPENSRWLKHLSTMKDDQAIVDVMFWTVFGRAADDEESRRCVEFLAEHHERRPEGLENLAWALVTSAEFRFNH